MSFNPHTHAGCDYLLLKYLYYCQSFNPHTHAGCDSAISLIRYRIMSFNPHTHAGCDYLLLKYLYYCQSFNPHTHAGCDPTKLSNGANEIVSIHTPTQGVTIGGLDQQIKSKVSIHTPTQGVTRIIWISIYLICFNPHTHAGCDRRTCNIGNSKAAVSIHTPTQGVTIVEWFTGVFDMFQSTHPRRV